MYLTPNSQKQEQIHVYGTPAAAAAAAAAVLSDFTYFKMRTI